MRCIQVLHHSISPFHLHDPQADPRRYRTGWPMIFARAIRAHDPGVTVECWRPERTLRGPYEWRDDDGTVHRVFPSFYLRYGYEWSPGLLRAVRAAARDPEVAFVVHGSYNLHAYLLGPMLARSPAILQSHGGFPAHHLFRVTRHRWLRWALLAVAPVERWTLPRYPHVFVLNDEERNALSRLLPADRVTVSPVGVDFARFSPGDRAAARCACGLDREARLVLYVGRLSPEKGVPHLLEALGLARRRIAGLRLVVIGCGPLEGQLRSQVERLGLAESVRFVGRVPNAELPVWYRAAEVTVMPSLREGFGLVAVESLACGTPIVASRVGGTTDIARAFECGVLVPPRDPPALADAIAAVLSKSVPTTPNVGRGRARFGWPAKLARMDALFAAMTASRGHRARAARVGRGVR